MLRNHASIIFVCVLTMLVSVQPAFALSTVKKDAQTPEQLKQRIVKFGVGEKARVTIKLKSGAKLKGYIYQAGEVDFIVRDMKTDSPTTVAYSDVEQIKGKNLSTGAKIAIGVGIGAVVFLVVAAVASVVAVGALLGGG